MEVGTFLTAVRTLQSARTELSRTLHLLGADLVALEQAVMAGRSPYAIHPNLMPKIVALEEAWTEFQKVVRQSVRDGFLREPVGA